jgi:molecular chaperone GrpE (heat shock protein)
VKENLRASRTLRKCFRGNVEGRSPDSTERKIMNDSDFYKFQDDFYDLLEKYGVSNINSEHQDFNMICDKRNDIIDFIDELRVAKEYYNDEKLEEETV